MPVSPRIRRLAVVCAIVSTALASQAGAQPASMTMSAGTMPAGGGAGATMMQPMQTMHAAMARVPMAGNTDQEFAAMMIPHHQAAIDMARIELRDGHDPQLRRLAHAIIASQAKEITSMTAWLAKHPQ